MSLIIWLHLISIVTFSNALKAAFWSLTGAEKSLFQGGKGSTAAAE